MNRALNLRTQRGLGSRAPKWLWGVQRACVRANPWGTGHACLPAGRLFARVANPNISTWPLSKWTNELVVLSCHKICCFLMVLIDNTGGSFGSNLRITYAVIVCGRSRNSTLSESESEFRIQFKSFFATHDRERKLSRWAFTKVLIVLSLVVPYLLRWFQVPAIYLRAYGLIPAGQPDAGGVLNHCIRRWVRSASAL